MYGLNLIQLSAAVLFPLLAAAVSGCHDGHDGSCKDIPCGAIPQPNGEYLCQWTNSERARAGQDSYVVYQYEWSAEPVKLTTTGQEHVACMAHVLGQTPYPVIIDPSPDGRLNELRRIAVIEALAASGCPTDPARVCVGHPEAEGLYGQKRLALQPGCSRTRMADKGRGAAEAE